jgi:hypothetical protein
LAFAIHARMTRLTQPPFDPGHLETPGYLFSSPRGRATLSPEGNKRLYGERSIPSSCTLPSLAPRSLSPPAACVYLYLSGPGRTLLLPQLGAKSQQDLPIKEARADVAGIRKSIRQNSAARSSSLDKQTSAAHLFTSSVFNFSQRARCVNKITIFDCC